MRCWISFSVSGETKASGSLLDRVGCVFLFEEEDEEHPISNFCLLLLLWRSKISLWQF